MVFLMGPNGEMEATKRNMSARDLAGPPTTFGVRLASLQEVHDCDPKRSTHLNLDLHTTPSSFNEFMEAGTVFGLCYKALA